MILGNVDTNSNGITFQLYACLCHFPLSYACHPGFSPRYPFRSEEKKRRSYSFAVNNGFS